MKKVLTIILLSSLNVFSCEIMFHENFIFTSTDKMNDLIKESNCTASMNKSVIDIFRELRGKVNIDFIKNEHLKDKDITLSPRLINIKSFSEFFKSRIETSDSQKTFNEQLIGRDSLSWDHEKTISISCPQCDSNGSKQVAIKIINYIENSETTVWAKFDLLEKTKVLVNNNDSLKSFVEINPKGIKEEYRYVKNPGQYFDNLELLRFYKTNKNIRAGSALKNTDISKRALIKPGNYVNVILEVNGIKIKRKAKSMSYGYFGDSIKLMTSKRTEIFGVASGDNEVTVQL